MQQNARRHARAVAIAATHNDRQRKIAITALTVTLSLASLYAISALTF